MFFFLNNKSDKSDKNHNSFSIPANFKKYLKSLAKNAITKKEEFKEEIEFFEKNIYTDIFNDLLNETKDDIEYYERIFEFLLRSLKLNTLVWKHIIVDLLLNNNPNLCKHKFCELFLVKKNEQNNTIVFLKKFYENEKFLREDNEVEDIDKSKKLTVINGYPGVGKTHMVRNHFNNTRTENKNDLIFYWDTIIDEELNNVNPYDNDWINSNEDIKKSKKQWFCYKYWHYKRKKFSSTSLISSKYTVLGIFIAILTFLITPIYELSDYLFKSFSEDKYFLLKYWLTLIIIILIFILAPLIMILKIPSSHRSYRYKKFLPWRNRKKYTIVIDELNRINENSEIFLSIWGLIKNLENLENQKIILIGLEIPENQTIEEKQEIIESSNKKLLIDLIKDKYMKQCQYIDIEKITFLYKYNLKIMNQLWTIDKDEFNKITADHIDDIFYIIKKFSEFGGHLMIDKFYKIFEIISKPKSKKIKEIHQEIINLWENTTKRTWEKNTLPIPKDNHS